MVYFSGGNDRKEKFAASSWTKDFLKYRRNTPWKYKKWYDQVRMYKEDPNYTLGVDDIDHKIT